MNFSLFLLSTLWHFFTSSTLIWQIHIFFNKNKNKVLTCMYNHLLFTHHIHSVYVLVLNNMTLCTPSVSVYFIQKWMKSFTPCHVTPNSHVFLSSVGHNLHTHFSIRWPVKVTLKAQRCRTSSLVCVCVMIKINYCLMWESHSYLSHWFAESPFSVRKWAAWTFCWTSQFDTQN